MILSPTVQLLIYLHLHIWVILAEFEALWGIKGLIYEFGREGEMGQSHTNDMYWVFVFWIIQDANGGRVESMWTMAALVDNLRFPFAWSFTIWTAPVNKYYFPGIYMHSIILTCIILAADM